MSFQASHRYNKNVHPIFSVFFKNTHTKRKSFVFFCNNTDHQSNKNTECNNNEIKISTKLKESQKGSTFFPCSLSMLIQNVNLFLAPTKNRSSIRPLQRME